MNDDHAQLDRRTACALGGMTVAAALSGWGMARRDEERFERAIEAIPTRLAMPNVGFAHPRLLANAVAAPTVPGERVGVLILGGGVAGLAAAWALRRRGFADFALLELESEAGGNARGGVGVRGRYPRGAHYLPLPGPELVLVREFLAAAGVLTGYDDTGRPVFDELALCAAPQERLRLGGVWQDGLVPRLGVPVDERRDIERFFARMAEFRQARGHDGLPAFAIPVDASSRDDRFRELDQQSMLAWMEAQGLRSAHLRWYVDYCCRDDFGTLAAETSAWAGIHYFAARRGQAAYADDGSVLTWSDGNAELVRKLATLATVPLRAGMLATRLRRDEAGWVVEGCRSPDGAPFAIAARQVICAVPQFVAARLLPGRSAAGFSYAPWVVSNLDLAESPPDAPYGAPLAWDNVVFGAPSLGYVVADHQGLAAVRQGLSITHYWPLAGDEPKLARQAALAAAAGDWRRAVLGDLTLAHPGIERVVQSLELWIWGHAMVRPTPGFVWGSERRAAQRPLDGVHFAHSDLGGVSIFEEALYQGHAAASAALSALRGGA